MNPIAMLRRPFGRALGLFASALLSLPALGAVGRTEASYGVTKDGAATYSIPIRATEGINGMTPRLSLAYAGSGTRSILGVGFALAGISYITPCRRTMAQDVTAAPITLTAADRYCLDGARLRQINSGDTYGASNVQYRTELDQMVRVTSKASSGNIPGWFSVEMPDGLTYEYGNSANSKLMSGTGGGATPQFWAVSKISDPNGNEIVFSYDTDAAQRRFRPDVISYTQRGGSGHYQVVFVYQSTSLPFKMQHFTPSQSGGAAHEHDKLLERIDLKHDNVTYRAYKLTYQSGAGDNARLATVQECGYATGEDCLPATNLSWQSATAGHNGLASTSKAVTAGVVPLDINGDGIEDLVWAASGTWRYMLGSASGYGAITNTTVTATNPAKALPLEWNGDGFADLLIDWSDGKWRVLRGGASGFNTSVVAAGSPAVPSNTANTSWTVSDVNADGLDDLLSMTLNAALQVNVRHNSATGFGASTVMYADQGFHLENKGFIQPTGASSIRRPDFNGDSRFDLLIYACFWDDELGGCLASYRWYQLMSNGTSFTWEGAIPNASYNIDVRFGDFNADGLTDIVYPQASTWGVGLGQGSGGFAMVTGPSTTGHATYQTLVGDYDGDGYDDLYVTNNSPFQWDVFRSTGTALATTPISTGISGTGLGWALVNQDSDDLPDLGRYDTSTFIWSLGVHQGLPAEILLSATDGLGNALTFTYLPMSNPTVYTKGTGAVLPARDYKGRMPLVRTLQVSPAGGTAYTFTYKYLNARIHDQGRSFLGMGERQITDGRNNVFTVETYRQDFPYIGAPATVTIKQSAASSDLIQSVTHTYFHHVLASFAGGERFLPYRNSSVTKIYEVGGSKNGNQITEITESATVNTFGNTTVSTTWVDDKDSGSTEYGSRWSTEVVAAYSEDQTSWCIALPTSRTVTNTLPDLSAAARSASWQVSGTECRITQETLEPGGSSLLSLVTDVGYDSCGNVNQVTSQPAGTPTQARVTTIDYGFSSGRCQRPEKITNAEGHVSTIAYNWPLALPATQTDPNGLATSLTYDALGRLTRQLRPDTTGVRFALTACTAGNSWCGKNSGARLKVTRTERSNTDAVLRTDELFVDGLGRTRWTHGDSLESGAAIVETLYDAFGRPVEQSQPYYAGGAVYATILTRDLIGRVTAIDAPISEAQTSGRLTSFNHEGRSLLVTDPENFITTRTSTALGQLRSITDPGTGGVTEYSYHPFGELASIEDTGGNLTTWSVNIRGFVDGTSDPDSGNWTFTPNAFGEATSQTDAKGQLATYTFDKLGRPKTRIETEGTTTFTWGTAAHNTASNKYIGRLKSVTSPGGYTESYLFDAYARLTRLRTTIEGTNHDFNYVYLTASGLLNTAEYPVSVSGTRLRIQYQYQNNLVKRVKEFQGTTTYWEANSTDAWGHYQDELFGNGIQTVTDFDQASGLMTGREGGVGGGTGRINSLVDWHDDLRGNITEREDLKLSPTVSEVFANDSISRLDAATRNGSGNLAVTYDANGNILTKDGQTYVYTRNTSGCTYGFPHLQPRAVHKIGSVKYCYDANGNMTKRDGSTISYSSYNLPTVINQGSNSSTLSYGAFRNRYKQVAVSAGATETTLYVAGLFEKVTLPGGVVEYRHYIPGGNGTAAIHTRRSSGTNSTYYWHADHLGSPELFTNSSGGEEVRPSFGAFGERRDGSDWLGPPSAADLAKIAGITRRGFTGHEHLDSVGLIHMNGRVYDPGIGRFLGVDPIVGVGVSQDANSYNYAWNSPLNVVDPSGLTDVVYNCINGCGAFPWPSEPLYPEIYEDPAGYAIDNPGIDFGWVVKDRWDGKSALAGRSAVKFGVSTADGFTGAAQRLFADVVGELEHYAGNVRASWGELPGDASLDSNLAALPILGAIRAESGIAKFSGGAFSKLKRVSGWVRHHIPADSISPLARSRGPAIQMEIADHLLTSSYGSSAAARAFRQEIQALIQQGRWREAIAREIRDVRRIAGSKYNEAVQDMLEYMRSIGLLE